MPKQWLYFIALVMPLILRVALLDTAFVDWLWYHNQVNAYTMLTTLSVQPQFIEFIGGWALPTFIITMFSYWISQGDYDDMDDQFLMLPIFYIPFTIIGDVLVTRQFHPENLYVHPLIIIPFGYLYVFTWVIFIRVLDKLQLVL